MEAVLLRREGTSKWRQLGKGAVGEEGSTVEEGSILGGKQYC